MGQRESAVFIGEASLLVQVATRWLAAGHTVVAVMSNDSAIREFAASRGLAVLAAGDYAGLHALRDATPFTALFSVANLVMLPASVLALPSRHAINFHDGPLPRYSGLNATSWAIAHGERTHGVTWHEMTATADAGRIFAQQAVAIRQSESA
jgi:methionyl-tRNA formyltransferase